jgi:hypothetical protein
MRAVIFRSVARTHEWWDGDVVAGNGPKSERGVHLRSSAIRLEPCTSLVLESARPGTRVAYRDLIVALRRRRATSREAPETGHRRWIFHVDNASLASRRGSNGVGGHRRQQCLGAYDDISSPLRPTGYSTQPPAVVSSSCSIHPPSEMLTVGYACTPATHRQLRQQSCRGLRKRIIEPLL